MRETCAVMVAISYSPHHKRDGFASVGGMEIQKFAEVRVWMAQLTGLLFILSHKSISIRIGTQKKEIENLAKQGCPVPF